LHAWGAASRRVSRVLAELIADVRADLLRYCMPGSRYQDATWSWIEAGKALLNEQGAWAVVDYRVRRWARTLPSPARQVAGVVGFPIRKLIEAATGIVLPGQAEFGPGLYVGHFGEVIVSGDVVAGENCNLSQGVTLGFHRGAPRLGDSVYVAPGAKVFGPVVIGDHVSIGANAVVNEDVPAHATVVAGRAQVLEGRGNRMGDAGAPAA
jgi:serine O-acetyltransferase